MFFGDRLTLEFDEWTGMHDETEVEIHVRLYRVNLFQCSTEFKVPRDRADGDNLPLHIAENDLVKRALERFKVNINEQFWKAKYTVDKMAEAVPLVTRLTASDFKGEDE
jgi:hypothetical protein